MRDNYEDVFDGIFTVRKEKKPLSTLFWFLLYGGLGLLSFAIVYAIDYLL